MLSNPERHSLYTPYIFFIEEKALAYRTISHLHNTVMQQYTITHWFQTISSRVSGNPWAAFIPLHASPHPHPPLFQPKKVPKAHSSSYSPCGCYITILKIWEKGGSGSKGAQAPLPPEGQKPAHCSSALSPAEATRAQDEKHHGNRQGLC